MKLTGLLVAFLGIAVAARTMASVELSLRRIEETRNSSLMEEDVNHANDGLKIICSLAGPEADAAVRYGNVKFQEAIDDKGTNLIPAKDDPLKQASKLKDYENAFFRKMAQDQKEKPPMPQVELLLGSAKRSATKIAHLRGTLDLSTQGTIKTLELTRLKSIGKKKLDIPATAGIAITISVQPADKIQSINVELTGDENSLESMEILSSTGETLSTGMSSISFNGGPPRRSLDLLQGLDDSMKLVVKVAVDRKITPVQFDLKDIALP